MKLQMLNIIIPLFIIFTSCQKEPSNKTRLKREIKSIAKKNHIPSLSVIVKSANVNLDFKYQDCDKNIEPITYYGLASTTKFLSALLILKKSKKIKLGKRHNSKLY